MPSVGGDTSKGAYWAAIFYYADQSGHRLFGVDRRRALARHGGPRDRHGALNAWLKRAGLTLIIAFGAVGAVTALVNGVASALEGVQFVSLGDVLGSERAL